MKQSALIVALLATLVACSKQEANTASNQAAPAANQSAPAAPAVGAQPGMPAPAAGAGMGDAGVPAGHPGMPGMAPAPAAANKYQGKVKQVNHAAGYTYIEVDNNGQSLWIACMPTNVQAGDTVAWGDGAVMSNFESKTLHRTFDQILFVNAVSKVN